MQIDEKIGPEALTQSLEEEHTPAEPPGDAAAEPPQDASAQPDAPAQPPPPQQAQRGRPFAKGQSGNPRGRPPSYTHKAAWVAQRMLDRKTVDLVDKVIGWGQGSDRSMLRLFTQKMVPPRHEVPVWLNIPPIETHSDLKAALRAVANGVAQGDIPSAQGLRLVKLFNELYCHL
jgi:hypothetical protein